MTEEGTRSLEQEELAFSAYYNTLHEDNYDIYHKMDDPIAFKVTYDPDTMYYHQAMRALDKNKFVKVMIKEVEDHIQRND